MADLPEDHARRAEGRRTIEGLDRALATGTLSEADWYTGARTVLEEVYLPTNDPVPPIGDARRRRPLGAWPPPGRWGPPTATALSSTSGCANGLLMESVVSWAEESGHRVEPYGLDHSPALAALARRRLPRWADRIFVGNVADWVPPRRFDVVRTE